MDLDAPKSREDLYKDAVKYLQANKGLPEVGALKVTKLGAPAVVLFS